MDTSPFICSFLNPSSHIKQSAFQGTEYMEQMKMENILTIAN